MLRVCRPQCGRGFLGGSQEAFSDRYGPGLKCAVAVLWGCLSICGLLMVKHKQASEHSMRRCTVPCTEVAPRCQRRAGSVRARASVAYRLV